MSGEVPENLKYAKTHEWVEVKGNIARVGITDHAQSELTDIVFVEFPETGKVVKQGDEICVVESVKSVSEIYAPVSGKVVNINKELEDSPEKINQSPYEEGWLVEIDMSNPDELNNLLSAEDYKKITG
ncbi:MAG: glycine cleavage system protein GcvH [Thermoplasmata archaeon]|nr:MAG: glycine cleavage system protein GcvH [Thermoplasmata archaeon]HDD57343.1 glycine cleavage system protein GcvH [Thermoplasmatales archaeon]